MKVAKKQMYAILFAILVLLTGVLLTFFLLLSYRQTLAVIKISSANESHILASRMDGTLRRIEASSDLVVENASLHAMAEVAAQDNIEQINHHLKVLARYFPEILGHLIFNAEGRLLFSSDPTIHPSSIADRAYFQQIKEHPQTGIQFSENLDAKTTNKPIIVAYRAILGDRKEFLGLIATPIDLGFFEKLFAELDLGAQGMVSIRRSDNSRLVVRWPDIQERRNNEAKHIPPQQHIEKGIGDGVVRYMGKTDGVDRIFAFHKIPTYPFYVLIGRAVHEQFAEWYKIAVMTVLLTFLALLLIGFFLYSLTKSQSSLQKSEAQYQAIVENQHDAVCRWLPETTLTFANEKYVELFSIDKVRIGAGLCRIKFIPSEQLEAIRGLFADPETQSRSLSTEHPIALQDGTVRHFQWLHVPLFDDEGHCTEFQSAGRDITELKNAEITLRESEARTRAIADSANDGIVIMDNHGLVSYWNPAAVQIFGYSNDEVLGKNLHRLIAPLPYHALHDQALGKFQKSGQGPAINATLELTGRHKNGHEISLELSLASLNVRGEWHAIGIIRDITERKQAEEEKKNLTTRLQQSQKMEAIGTLAGGIAHDFNNILGAILGYAEMIRDDCPADSIIAHDISQVIRAGNRAKELVKQILAFSHQSEAVKLPVQPATIIKEAVAMLRASLPTTITIEQDIAPDAGVILADPTQIHQILMNLGTNAFHAMEMAGGILSISLHQKTLSEKDLGLGKHMQPGNFIQLSVRDNGVGIAPEIRGKIFDPYFTTKAVGKGTGMGLAMVHGIVQSYGGSITCDSQVGEGTVFHITLPVAEAGSIKEKECTELIPVGREHILLIDDEQMLAEMSKAMLERLGYRVTSETNSIEALVTFRKQPQLFDLMITDQTMPGMTGIDLARLMLQIRPGLPIILCTGYSTLISEEKAKSLGIKGFALKPVTKEGLGTLVRRVLDGDTITGRNYAESIS
jgi:PAS domain S-box-containing protein